MIHPKDQLSDADQRYKIFVQELIQREKNGEIINYEKESVDYWNKELKKLRGKIKK